MVYRWFFKRVADLVLSFCALLVLAPLLMVLAGLVAVTMGRPVFFCQKRPGRDGKLFRLIKFRSMRELRDETGTSLSDAARLTPFGRFLRSTSLDELPELWNVLSGDMSLVGPRPLLPQYLGRYSPEQNRRHEVRPGITGWAQVNGRNVLSWEERFRLDVWYVDHLTFWLDMRILWMTVYQVIRRKGISQPGSATMPEFRGRTAVEDKTPRV